MQWYERVAEEKWEEGGGGELQILVTFRAIVPGKLEFGQSTSPSIIHRFITTTTTGYAYCRVLQRAGYRSG